MTSPLALHWTLDPTVTFLNHGSFGACPRKVLEAQSAVRARMEREPVRFFVRDLEGELDRVRTFVSELVGAAAEDIAFVSNATAGVNAVLSSLEFAAGDELLCTDHVYNAVGNTLERVSAPRGARVVRASVPFPVVSEDQLIACVLERVTERTRLAVLDHIASPTALVFPIARLVSELSQRGIDTLVDGAHAPGQVPLDLRSLGAAYYTGNFHKWCCAPKGAAFLHVRRDRRDAIRPQVTSHGANSPRRDRSRFLLEFDWLGTDDPSAILCVPEAVQVLSSLVPGGLPEVMAHNHALALAARKLLADALEVPLPCPESLVGSMAALPLPPELQSGVPDRLRGHPSPENASKPSRSSLYGSQLQETLITQYGIQVPVVPWPGGGKRLVRVSAQLYNALPQYQQLASALLEALRAEQGQPA